MKIEELLIATKEHEKLFISLFTNWQAEKDNKEFIKNLDKISKSLGVQVLEAIKRPFILKFNCSDGVLGLKFKKNGSRLTVSALIRKR